MLLYYSPNSPYARKVRATAIELDVLDSIELRQTDARDPSTGMWAFNPLAKVPTLRLDDGSAIFDSPVICEYLNETFGGRLMPADPARRAEVRSLVALADGIIDAGMLARHEGLRPEGERSPAWIDKQLAVVDRGFDRLDTITERLSRPVDLGIIAVACAVGWVLFRHGALDLLGNRGRLARWHDEVSCRPALSATAPA